jgi:hypothetical protein
MLEKKICNTVAKYVKNVLHDVYGISCKNNLCKEVAEMFIYMHVGKIDCGKLICGNPPEINFDPNQTEEKACKTITIEPVDNSKPCKPLIINL